VDDDQRLRDEHVMAALIAAASTTDTTAVCGALVTRYDDTAKNAWLRVLRRQPVTFFAASASALYSKDFKDSAALLTRCGYKGLMTPVDDIFAESWRGRHLGKTVPPHICEALHRAFYWTLTVRCGAQFVEPRD
jgi:hypothetical protein